MAGSCDRSSGSAISGSRAFITALLRSARWARRLVASEYRKESDPKGSTSEAPCRNTTVKRKPATPQVIAKTADELDETEIAQNFTPLPYADDPSMMEGGSVVRVILSRSALASLGMPLSGVENREQISADLVVSADGTPEAIRFVAQNVDEDSQH